MMHPRLLNVALVALALTGTALLAACGGTDTGVSDDRVPSAVVVIDVRTAEEFAAGHLDGALNIDVQSPDFDERIGALDPDAAYVVYCRSGNRSGIAVARMAELGVGDAVNGGSLEAAAESTGLPIVP